MHCHSTDPETREARIGILLFETAGQRIRGDAGYPGTFPFPVVYGLVRGSYRDLINGSETVRLRVMEAAAQLRAEGIQAIAGDCGLMALYQREIAEAAQVPVIASSLVLLPLIRSALSPDAAVGVVTGHSALLAAHHLKAAGSSMNDVTIQGMEDEPHFRAVVIDGTAPQHYDLMKADLLSAAGKLLAKAPDVGAFLLECSNLATFSRDLYEAYGIPVFDINLAVRLLYAAVSPLSYKE